MTISKKKAAVVVIATILSKRRAEKRRTKRLWVRDFIQKRETENITQNLIRDLRNDETNIFKEYFRLSTAQFDILLDKVRSLIEKIDTNMRKSISTEARLLITLRYLSSGDSYRSLMLLFRVPHNTISGIVSETCDAIYSALRTEYLKVKSNFAV